MSNGLDTAVQGPSPGALTAGDTPSPTVTHYQQLAEAFMKALDDLIAGLPPLESPHPLTMPFVRGKANVKRGFLLSAVAAVEQVPALRGVDTLDPVQGRDTLQFLEAFQTLADRMSGFANELKFTLRARHAALANAALQIYAIAKGVNRDPSNSSILQHVENMKRFVARKGRKTATPPPAPQPPAAMNKAA
jgi:hypothetical protein